MKKHSQNDEAESLPVVGLLALAMISTPVAFPLVCRQEPGWGISWDGVCLLL